MAGYPRVTHPSATKFKITRFHLNFVRLACVKHAASVHPEPGSNSHVEMFSPCQNIWLFPFLKLFVQAFGITVFRLFLNFSLIGIFKVALLFICQGSCGFHHERRRRDLNPRAAINDLHPFQGCPFGQLGYFSKHS